MKKRAAVRIGAVTKWGYYFKSGQGDQGGLNDRVIFDQRPERSESMSHAFVCGKNSSIRGNRAKLEQVMCSGSNKQCGMCSGGK